MTDNFIMQTYIEDLDLCDDLIDYFKNNPEHQHQGCIAGYKINKQIKDSIDMSDDNLSDELRNRYYGKELNCAIKKYIDKYEFSLMCPFGFAQPGNIQYYKPGMAFHLFHCERTDISYPGTTRHLAWMTYLNDVDDGGETEFYYQKLKVKPRKGLTLIWPADWTHTHRGLSSPTQEKYIITGWLNYIDRDLDNIESEKTVVIS
jgi:hypothetical protein